MSVDAAQSRTIIVPSETLLIKHREMHEKGGGCLRLIAVDTFMQRTESLSLSALITWTNQCLLGWKRLARPQCRPDDEGTHLLSVRGPPTRPEHTRFRATEKFSLRTSSCVCEEEHTGYILDLGWMYKIREDCIKGTFQYLTHTEWRCQGSNHQPSWFVGDPLFPLSRSPCPFFLYADVDLETRLQLRIFSQQWLS